MKKGGSESGEFLRWDVSCCLHLKQSGTVSVLREATLRLSLRAGFLEKREKWRTPSCFARCQKTNALYFTVKVAHPLSACPLYTPLTPRAFLIRLVAYCLKVSIQRPGAGVSFECGHQFLGALNWLLIGRRRASNEPPVGFRSLFLAPQRRQRGALVVPRMRNFGVDLQSPVIAGDRLFVAPHLRQRGTLVVPRRCNPGVDLQSPVIAGDGLLLAPKNRQRGALVVPRKRNSGVDPQSPVIAGYRLFLAPQIRQRGALLGPPTCNSGRALQRPVVAGDGLLLAPQIRERNAPVEPRKRISRVALQCLLIAGDGLLLAP